MSKYITVTPCEAPVDVPGVVRRGQWWAYSATTLSGRNTMSGRMRGTKEEARRAALRALRRMEACESPMRVWNGSIIAPYTVSGHLIVEAF